MRDSGESLASEPFVAAYDSTLSFAIRAPVYARGARHETVEERRTAFRGAVAVLVDLRALFAAVLASQPEAALQLAVQDRGARQAQAGSAPARVLYDSRRGVEPQPQGGYWTRTTTLDAAGRVWELTFSAPAEVTGLARTIPSIVFQGGMLTTLLLMWLVRSLNLARLRALQLAEQSATVRKAETLQEQLEFMQRLIEAMPQPIYFKDAAGRYLGVNAAWERFFDVARERCLGRTAAEVLPAAAAEAEARQVVSDGPGTSVEAAIPMADGAVRKVMYNQAAFTSGEGEAGGVIGLITDITALKDVEARLRESEARFRDLAELSSDWFWEQDEQYRYTDVAARVEQLDVTAGGFIGRTCWDMPVTGVSEETWAAHRATLDARDPFTDFTYQRQNGRGELRTITVSGKPVFDEDGRFRGYRGTARDITRTRQAEEQIRHMAHHDALTGLPNRVLLYDRLEQLIHRARRDGSRFGVLFIDLDRFKIVNDTLGHKVGDQLLRVVAERILGCLREADTVARIGGDEFVVLLVDCDEAPRAAQVAQKLVDALARAFDLEGYELYITPSIGISLYPGDGEDTQTLMSNADAAMYHAKETGRNNFQFFTRQMSIAAHHRLGLEHDLRHALERHEFFLYYQPQVDLRSGAIIGFEALLRWRHPERGLVPPSVFVPIAEETGLIIAIGDWVLATACAQARAWIEMGHPHLQVSVNCSAQQFRRDDYVARIAATLREHHLPASTLELEITESVIMQHTEQVLVHLKELHDMGVKLSLDDFGTGYSSMSYLKRFPIQKLKIDQSFVRDITADPDDAAIATAIIVMAHSLGLTVMAEGVETRQQLAFLKSLKCDQAQGYYFSAPVSSNEFELLLGNPARVLRAEA